MIHLSVDGLFPQRILIIASAMLLGRRTQQQIHLYWKDPINQGDNYHQYFQAIEDIKLRQWFPELEKILKEQHPNIYLLPQPTKDNPNPPIPTDQDDYYLHLPMNPISLPDQSHPVFYREEPGIYLKSNYEKVLSKFVRKFRPLPETIQMSSRIEATIFKFPKKTRIGIYLTIDDKHFLKSEEVIKQLLLEYPQDKFQFFFSCNMHYYQNEISKKFPRLKTFNEHKKTQDHFVEGRQFQLVDGFLLSTCQKIIVINLSDPPYLSWLLSDDRTPLQVIQVTEN